MTWWPRMRVIPTGSLHLTPARPTRYCQPRTVSLLDQQPDPSCPAHSPAQCSHDRPVCHVELRPLDLMA